MTVAQLDYAPGAPVRRRTLIRRAAVLVALVGVAVFAWRYGPGAIRQARVLYFQRQCLAYSAPADRVVYDENSDTTVERLKTAGYGGLWTSGTKQAAVYIAPEVQSRALNLPGAANSSGAKCGSEATVFVHELRNAAGVRRLVLVERGPNRFIPIFEYAFGLDVSVFEPATWRSGLKRMRMANGVDWNGPATYPPTKGLRFYAGQVDPADAGHFTIRYDLEGKSGVIDGRLNDAGDDVKITVRSGPGMAPSPWTTQVGR